ncbi:hypothetical protein [Aeromicrobium stalagmiti]|nr:hypothetical protein [Aeromicrobium stalagmiti]NRQ51624.1 hypothetical protein [Aeromicrobium stalagmiti]
MSQPGRELQQSQGERVRGRVVLLVAVGVPIVVVGVFVWWLGFGLFDGA